MSREILSPPIIAIGNRRYRINPIHDGYRSSNLGYPKPVYQEEDLFDEDDDDDDGDYDIEELQNSMFRLKFHVPKVLYGGLIGQKGITKKRIESETKTDIFIPGLRDTSENLVTIKGKSRKDVCTARRRLQLVAESLRNKAKPTHFTCVPTCTEAIKKAYNNFKESILNDNIPGIDEDLFMGAEKLHITFSACKLLDDEERVKAAQIFNECKEFLTKGPPIRINIRDLEIMNDDPSSVGVLYACIDSPELEIFSSKIFRKFKDANLVSESDKFRNNPKLHMTLMNVSGRLKKDPLSMTTFDARTILKKYANYDFGTMVVNEVHLSQMHTTGPNGFYIATGILRL